jgi:hypothetical protein
MCDEPPAKDMEVYLQQIRREVQCIVTECSAFLAG